MRGALAAGAAVVAVGLLVVLLVRDSGDAGGSDSAEPPPGRACTLIGCGPGVRVDVTAAPADVHSARVCVDGRCGAPQRLDRPVPLTASVPRAARRDGERIQVTVRLLDRNGRSVGEVSRRATVRSTRPNGPDCPPVCFQARVRIDATRAT